MLLAALRRLTFLVLLCVGFTVVLSLLLGTLAGSPIARSLALGFYAMGCFLLVAGFFTGNRGPARVKSESAGPMMLPLLFFPRKLRWATRDEQNDTMKNSGLFIFLGLVLVVIGFFFDSRHALF